MNTQPNQNFLSEKSSPVKGTNFQFGEQYLLWNRLNNSTITSMFKTPNNY